MEFKVQYYKREPFECTDSAYWGYQLIEIINGQEKRIIDFSINKSSERIAKRGSSYHSLYRYAGRGKYITLSPEKFEMLWTLAQ